MSKLIKQFLLAGIIRPKHNRRYTLSIKVAAVKAYLSGEYTNQKILERYQIRNISQLRHITYWRLEEGLNYLVDKSPVLQSINYRVALEIRPNPD